MNYEEISKIFYAALKDELERKPKTAAEINNPMNHDKKEALFNAIFCYDEKDQLCGFNIQPRIEENEIYKLRFYLPLIDTNWAGVKTLDKLPDKKIKVGFDGEYVSQNELLKKKQCDARKSNVFQLQCLWCSKFRGWRCRNTITGYFIPGFKKIQKCRISDK